MRLLTVTATIAAGGQLVEPRWIVDANAPRRTAVAVLPRAAADRLARDMAMAVSSGTGRSVAGVKPVIAGKTGTAEVAGGRSHAWFTGFAPYGGTTDRTIAFVVLVEHGGYGARAAAPIAGELVTAARELGLFESE
jgi:cell division protein FtsI/penicillin-binding protein 2